MTLKGGTVFRREASSDYYVIFYFFLECYGLRHHNHALTFESTRNWGNGDSVLCNLSSLEGYGVSLFPSTLERHVVIPFEHWRELGDYGVAVPRGRIKNLWIPEKKFLGRIHNDRHGRIFKKISLCVLWDHNTTYRTQHATPHHQQHNTPQHPHHIIHNTPYSTPQLNTTPQAMWCAVWCVVV